MQFVNRMNAGLRKVRKVKAPLESGTKTHQHGALEFGMDLSVANLGAALQQLPEAAALLGQAQAVAPPEIKADLTVLAGTLEELTPLLSRIATLNAAAKTDAAAATEAQKATLELMGRLTSTQSSGFATAVANLNAYSKQHCGVKFV